MHMACPSGQVSSGNGTEIKRSGLEEIIAKDGHLRGVGRLVRWFARLLLTREAKETEAEMEGC